MKSYQIVKTDTRQTRQMLEAFPRAAELEPVLQAALVTAWVSVLASSTFERIVDVPFSYGSGTSLVDHTNDVTEAGLALMSVAAERWGWQVNRQTLLAVLLLHDVDKPLLMEKCEGNDLQTPVASRIPHGVLGALLLAELGLDEAIVAAVATHATNAPVRGPDPEVMILHYADLFAADSALLKTARLPFFRRCG
ncbi:HD domain-containing protein [Sagittula sp. NFXS13]|uniref:HD domain-containing protein n=1 Tax=Sagittula sp. NFXS13 TaxID=2819095 RepID=UPI0032DE398F